MKYRNKPIEIEAQQWWPPGDERHDPAMLRDIRSEPTGPGRVLRVGDLFLAMPGHLRDIGGDDIYKIRTRNDDLRVMPGDWIITGANGEKYPCKPDIFEATYEAIGDGGVS